MPYFDDWPKPERVEWIVVHETEGYRCAFLRAVDLSPGEGTSWGAMESCTRFSDPADAVAAALKHDALVGVLETYHDGRTSWRFA